MLLRVSTSRFRTLQGLLSVIECGRTPSFTVRSMTMGHPNTLFADPRPAPLRSYNKHVNPGTEHVHLEEPLGVTAEQGHGFPWIEFRDAMGPDKRYKVVRKLGWGMNSSIWMAFDGKEKRYVAIKVLTGYATNLSKRGLTWELPALQRISSFLPLPGFESTHCPQLLDHFMHPGREQDGDHLCLVTTLLGGDVKCLQIEAAGKRGFPLPLAKHILLHTLRGLAHMHHYEIVHTDLKHDNIMFDAGSLTQADIEALVDGDPPRRHPPEESRECSVRVAISQPLPLPSLSDAMSRTYLVSDFGGAQPSQFCTNDEITAPTLRAPEIILQGPWDEKVDIWAFGCLIFELVTGSALFEHKPYPKYALDETTAHLWQILCFTRERITRQQVEASKLGAQYFDLAVNPDDVDNPFCDLKARPRIYNSPFIALLERYNVLKGHDVLATAKIMQKCLRLNPEDRATAQELLQDDWWQGAA